MAMTTDTFDALALGEDFESAGFDKRRAKAVAGAGRAGLSARADVRRLENDIRLLRENMAAKADIASLETRLAVRFFGGLLAVGGSIVAAIELL